ncbi:MAG: hypothetical protein ACFE9J_16060 [Candidatus Hermodarchaeota archaeon]
MKISEYFKERNVQIGILIITLATFILYSTTVYLYPYLFLYAGLQFIIGILIGEIYTLRNRSPDQTLLKCGIIVGIFGGILSSLVISIWHTILGHLSSFIDFLFFFGYVLITGVVMGLLIGGLMSSFYKYREMKADTYEGEKQYDEDFYEDLIDE